MSLKLKILYSYTILLAVSLGIVGYLLLRNSFTVSLETQIDRGMEEHQLIVSAIQAEIVDQIVNDSFTGISQIKGLGEEIAESLEGTEAAFLLFDEERELLYANREERLISEEQAVPEGLLDYPQRERCNYLIRAVGEQDILWIASVIEVRENALYIVNYRDITSVYQEQARQGSFYRILMLLVLVLGIGLVYLITSWLTKPMEQLNHTAAVIASGDYSVRTNVTSRDEIGELAESFDRMADAVELHVESLKEQARRQEDFVASFTHEIKTPMTSIIGYADHLRSKQVSEEQKIAMSDYIFREGKRLEAMSFQLFDLIALGRKEIDTQKIYMRVLEEELGQQLQTFLEPYKMRISCHMEEAVIVGNPDLLKTVWLNLVDNARKASAPESVIILSGKCVGEEYEVQVIDHGIGIPEEEISKIQEAFYMVDKSRARGQGGSGLGLATTTRIIEAHGGRMEIESVYGEGTVVHVYLPMDRKENTGLAVKEQGDKHMYQTGTEKRTRV